MAEPIFRVVLTMQVHPGREAEFEETWYAASGAVTGQPANLAHWLARDTREPSTYVITSDWVDEEQFRAYEGSPEHIAHREQLHPLRASGAMATYHVVRQLTGA